MAHLQEGAALLELAFILRKRIFLSQVSEFLNSETKFVCETACPCRRS